MTLSREEYIARAADAILKLEGFDADKQHLGMTPMASDVPAFAAQVRALAVAKAQAALDAVGAYETYEALGKAKETIRAWHSMDLSGADAGPTWRIYQGSPEMRVINAAISRAEGTEDQR